MKGFWRGKQSADQTLPTYGMPEPEDITASERKVEQLKNAVRQICKKLPQKSTPDKSLKKLNEYILGSSLKDPKIIEDDCLFKDILLTCGNTEVKLADEIVDHNSKVVSLIYSRFNEIIEQDIPNINKAKKHHFEVLKDKDNANNKYLSMQKQIEQNPDFEMAKVDEAKEKLEKADILVNRAKDKMATEIFSLLSKEMYLANKMLEYLKLQKKYHESSLHILTNVIPDLENNINDSPIAPVFGFPLNEHLRVTNRTIAYPIEVCICALYELGLSAEGLLRVTGDSVRMKRMKSSLNAGAFKIPLSAEYRNVHVIAGVFKLYLRELPDPLLTYSLYDAFISAITENSTDDSRLYSLWRVVNQLPEANMNNLRYIVNFLSLLTKYQYANKMTASNIAVVVAPNLLKSSDEKITTRDTYTINCVVELLVKHADWFFKDEMDFYLSFTKEELFPDVCENELNPNIYDQSSSPSIDSPKDDYDINKFMYEYSLSNGNTSQFYDPWETNSVVEKPSDSQRNSRDINNMNVDNEIKRTPSNSSPSDHFSPRQSIRKSKIRSKNKPVAPLPPNFVPPDKNKDQNSSTDISSNNSPQQNNDSNINIKNKVQSGKPDKPPRPNVLKTIAPISGSQITNQETCNSKQVNKFGTNISTSRDKLNEIFSSDRRNSLEHELETLKSKKSEAENTPTVNYVQSIVSQYTFTNSVVAPESTQASTQKNSSSIKSVNVPFKQDRRTTESVFYIPKERPVAAPRTITPSSFKSESVSSSSITDAEKQSTTGTSLSGNKPAIPEKPAIFRSRIFKGTSRKKPVSRSVSCFK